VFTVERQSKAAIARVLDLDVKTVRRCLQQTAWHPYQRAPEFDTLLTPYRAFLGRPGRRSSITRLRSCIKN
jgi:hypothetical protein